MRAIAHAALAASLMLGSVASAQDEYDPVPQAYAGPLVGYLFPESKRDADDGLNFQLVTGVVLGESLAIELTGFGTEISRKSDTSQHDYLYGGGIDLALGTPAPGNPLFLVGGGAVQQDIATVKKTSAYGEVGLGVYLPYSIMGELWRLEGRYHLVFNDHPALASEELLEDGRVNLGVLFTFGRKELPPDEEDVAPASTAPPPPPTTFADADQDGVADDIDKCPDTPAWVRADAAGCAPDSDGDGVDDPRDACPATASGTQVDASGCPPPAAQKPAAPPPDEDRDGVLDTADACPHTVPPFDVDEKGCVKPEDVTIKNVHFDIMSSRLTGAAYVLLRQVGAALKADPAMRLEVGGHADVTGPNRLNDDLALARAEVVRDFLTYLDIEEKRLTVKGYGNGKPVADNGTPEGRAMNRRVEFRRTDAK